MEPDGRPDSQAPDVPGGWRTEHDTMGEVLVPADAWWGAQTQRAIENFPISGRALPAALVAALGQVKGVAAYANGQLGVVEADVAQAIEAAADEVGAGQWVEQFPVDVFQTGSGTSSNMNANEVIARLAAERLGRPVHPNDHVNASQSSNDVFPTAIHVAALAELTHHLLPALDHLSSVLVAKAEQFADVVKAGRTHLMDATPVTLGQELAGYAAQLSQARQAVEGSLGRVGALPLGGTAVGTGLNCPVGFAPAAVTELARRTGLPVSEAPDHIAANSSRDALVELSGHLRTVAVALMKVANDIRWMGSGPRTGLAEVRIPDLQPGSSIMPGKVNPVLCEAVTQVCVQVFGNDATVAFAGSQGNFELNVYLPVMARNLLESIGLLGSVSRQFADRCIAGLEADVEQCRRYAESSPALGTSLNPYIGYEAAAEVVKESVRTGHSVRELAVERGLTHEQVDEALDVLSMTRNPQSPK